MSAIGKGAKSLRKQDLPTQRSIGVGIKKIVFYHKPTVGATGINLMSLAMPSEMASIGKTNPSATTLAGARLFFYQDNFSLFSSLRGWLSPQSYQITSSTQINFVGFTAADQEIFFGYLDNNLQPSLRAVDARALVNSGVLANGQTDFATDPFTTNMYPFAQIGGVLVFRNGRLQMRNTNNVTAAPGADGNYQEVPTSGLTSGLIRFNIAATSSLGDAIVVVSNGLLVERPTDSMMAYIENIAGQVNSMIPVLSDAAGVPTSTFGSNPSSVDLRQYGDQVLKNTTDIASLQTEVNPITGLDILAAPSGSGTPTGGGPSNGITGTIIWPAASVIEDDAAAYNAATGEWIVPKTDWYVVAASVAYNASYPSYVQAQVWIVVNGVVRAGDTRLNSAAAGTVVPTVMKPMKLNQGDRIRIDTQVNNATSFSISTGIGGSNFFSILNR